MHLEHWNFDEEVCLQKKVWPAFLFSRHCALHNVRHLPRFSRLHQKPKPQMFFWSSATPTCDLSHTYLQQKQNHKWHSPTWLAVRMMKLILQKGTNRLGKKKTASPKILKVVACFAVSWGLRLKESVSCGNQDSCARLVRPDIHHHLHLNCARLQRCIPT